MGFLYRYLPYQINAFTKGVINFGTYDSLFPLVRFMLPYFLHFGNNLVSQPFPILQ